MPEPNDSCPGSEQFATSVYKALAEYQVSDRWDLRELLRELHRWVEIFVCHFKVQIPNIVLCVNRLRFECSGHFRSERNGLGLQGEITINRRHVNGKEFWEVLGSLLHGLVHAWQNAHGKPGKPKYHNREFRRMAAEFGLIVAARGCGHQQYEPNGPFIRLLEEHGVHVPILPAVGPRPLGSSTLKLWICQCEPPYRVRVARAEFSATCNYCGHEFVTGNSKFEARNPKLQCSKPKGPKPIRTADEYRRDSLPVLSIQSFAF